MTASDFDRQNVALTAALSYASQGFPVVACYGIVGAGICTCGGRPNCKPGKHPLPKHGHLDATTDPDIIRRWWNDHPWANVALASGAQFFVWDIDPRNGGDATMAALVAEHGPPPDTPTVATGGGGEQYYLRLPPGLVIKSRPVAPGIDVKGKGLVIAPPSMHASGNRYTWKMPLVTPLANAPVWMLALAAVSQPTSRGEAASGGERDEGSAFTMRTAASFDLATHPGAGRGTQNDDFCHLLGIHISRGDSPATVEALALEWAARCDPPIPDHEVYSRLRWAEGKRTRDVDRLGAVGVDPSEARPVRPSANEQINIDGDACRGGGQGVSFVRSQACDDRAVGVTGPDITPHAPHLPPHGESGIGQAFRPDLDQGMLGEGQDVGLVGPAATDDWPELHADARYGLAGAIVNAIEPETEADPAGILLCFLAAFGNAVGKGPHFSMSAGVHHPNLFVALVGDSASGKGQAWSVVHRLMKAADPDWEAEAIAYGLSSGEGLVDRVKDGEADDSGEQGHFEFVMREAKRLFCVETEFAKPIVAMRREGNTLSPLLRSAWDAQVLEVLTRGKSKLRASNALVSVLANITPEEFEKLMGKSVEVANGFVNRFLWGCVRRSKLLPEGGDPGVLDVFIEPVNEALAKAKMISRVERDADAKALWAGEYEGLSTARPGAFGMATGRAHAQTLRLSLLYALLDGSDVVRVEHLRAALAVWRYCEASARRLFGGDAPGQIIGKSGGGGGSPGSPVLPLHLRLLDHIVKTPGITRRGLHEATGNRVKADDMEASLSRLESQGLVHRTRCQSEGGGRPAECWWPGPGSDGDSEDEVFTMGTDDVSAAPPAPIAGGAVGVETATSGDALAPLASEPAAGEQTPSSAERGRESVSSFADASPPTPLSPTTPNLPTQVMEAGVVGSRAIDPEEFFAEVVALRAVVDEQDVPITQDLYLEALRVAGIDPTMPPPYTVAQEKSLRWAKGYVLAQARRRQREEAMRQDEMTPEEFEAGLRAALGSDEYD